LVVEGDKAQVVEAMFDRIADRYDRMNRILTLGMDAGWRRKAIRRLGLAPGSLVLDLACGTGDLAAEASGAGHRAVGIDFAARMLARAQERAQEPGGKGPGASSTAGVALVRADIQALPVPDGVVDGVTCGFALRNVADLEILFAEMARVLRQGGRIAVLEVAQPKSRLLAVGHGFYFNKVVPFVGGLLSDRDAYRYLPASVAYLPPPDELGAMLVRAGIIGVRRSPLGGGAAQLITGTRA